MASALSTICASTSSLLMPLVTHQRNCGMVIGTIKTPHGRLMVPTSPLLPAGPKIAGAYPARTYTPCRYRTARQANYSALPLAHTPLIRLHGPPMAKRLHFGQNPSFVLAIISNFVPSTPVCSNPHAPAA